MKCATILARIQRLRLENASVQGAQHTGGLAGYAMGSTIEFIEVNGEVNRAMSTGGLLGFASGGSVQAIVADVSIQGGDRTGGLIGQTQGNTTIYYASTRGSVQGTSSVGGLVGCHSQALLSDIYSWAVVNDTSNVGGAVGSMAGTSSTRAYIYRCFSVGAVTGDASLGGFVGGSASTSHNTVGDGYWDTETSGLTHSAPGSGQPTAAMWQETPRSSIF